MASFSLKRRFKHCGPYCKSTRYKRRKYRSRRFSSKGRRYSTYRKCGYRGHRSGPYRRRTYRQRNPRHMRRRLVKRSALSYVTRTLADEDTNQLQYERVLTEGLQKNALPYILFTSHYFINIINHTPPFTHVLLQHYNRKSDMVCATGIRTHLDVAVSPKSGF